MRIDSTLLIAPIESSLNRREKHRFIGGVLPMGFYSKNDVLKPRICSRCNTINSPISNWCGECGFPLTWEGWEQYQQEQKEVQYIKDLQYLDRNYPDLDPHPLLKKKRKLPKLKVARCIRCNNLSETVREGVIVDYCPHCEAPFSERMIEREHWLYTHPEESKEELRQKQEILEKRHESSETHAEGPDRADSRRKILEMIKKDPSLLLEAIEELKQQSPKNEPFRWRLRIYRQKKPACSLLPGTGRR